MEERFIYQIVADYASATPIEKAKVKMHCLEEAKSLHPLSADALIKQAEELLSWLTQ